MGDMMKDTTKVDDEEEVLDEEEEEEEEEEDPRYRPHELDQWTGGEDYWQTYKKTAKDRLAHLYQNKDMSDLVVLACDENWWFGQTVKDFAAHKFPLATASPVLHKILYDSEDEMAEAGSKGVRMKLEEVFGVTLTLTPSWGFNRRLEMDGIPPIAAEGLMEYIYKDKFDATEFENGYSRNLLWRLWHASKALEMEHLAGLCTRTIHNTMCEETVFWDLNYSMRYVNLGTEPIRDKVLTQMTEMGDRLYEHPNFVWLDQPAIEEILRRNQTGSCEPTIIFNNVLRWSLYQLDRSACIEIDDKTGPEIPIATRLEWIAACRRGATDHSVEDLEKYICRGTKYLPWTEFSQKEFIEVVVPSEVLDEKQLLEHSIRIMEIVVQNPERLTKSAREVEMMKSRRNSLHQSVEQVKLREVKRRDSTRKDSRPNSRPPSMII